MIKYIYLPIIIIFIAVLILIFVFMPKKESQKEKLEMREPAVAGTFYPQDKKVLENKIDGFLNKAEKIELKEKPKILIVPHAGYDYSGQVAAFGFKQLKGKNFDKVILVGPSHTDWFGGVALTEKDIWETPLGKVEVDQEFNQKLIKENNIIFYRDKAHLKEHDLEVEIPFLQAVLSDFKIVPIVMGESTLENAEILADALAKNIDDKTLIIISSDLSHYPPYEIANQADKKVIDAILSGKVENFENAIKKLTSQDLEGLDTCACGEGPIKAALILAKKLGLKDIKLLKYANSGDVSGDYSKVVGYASIIFLENKNDDNLSDNEEKELLKIARESIEFYLKKNKISEFKVSSDKLKQPQGAFVTLKKEGQLRGCIGRIEETEKPLYEVVSEMAIAAATEDPRFYPISLDEMEDIDIEISVLSPLKRIKDPFKEIDIGRHGVLIKKGTRGGVFLPQVAIEENWSLEEFMDNLCEHKAGLSKDDWKNGKAEIYVFSAEVFGE